MKTHFILYVADQQKSTNFYSLVLEKEPKLNVPGMTEFELNNETILGLMPEKGIKSLLGEQLPDPSSANGIPRSEIYIIVDNPENYHQRAIDNGAKEISKIQAWGWGDTAAYSMDYDGHILVFAKHS